MMIMYGDLGNSPVLCIKVPILDLLVIKHHILEINRRVLTDTLNRLHVEKSASEILWCPFLIVRSSKLWRAITGRSISSGHRPNKEEEARFVEWDDFVQVRSFRLRFETSPLFGWER
jgi:hypothetical protein